MGPREEFTGGFVFAWHEGADQYLYWYGLWFPIIAGSVSLYISCVKGSTLKLWIAQ